MPLKRRKPTIRGAVRDVLLAPFVLVAVRVYAYRWVFAVAAACILLCWLLGGDFSGDFFDREFLVTFAGALVFIMIAAVPLASKDYFSGRGAGLIWESDEVCLRAARSYADMILRRDVESLRQHLHPLLTASMSADEIRDRILSMTAGDSPPVAIQRVEELPISTGDERCLDEYDAIVRVVFESASHVPQSVVELFLFASDHCRIVAWYYSIVRETGVSSATRA